MEWRPGLPVVAFAVLASLVLPSVARADATIGFEEYPAGTTLTNQYADYGGPNQGVTFGPLPGGAGDSGGRPVVTSAPGQAHSGNQVADINCPTCNEGIGYIPAATASFSVLHSRVSVYVGFLGSPSPPCAIDSTASTCAAVTLLAFDSSGHQIASSGPVTVAQGAGVDALLSVSTESPQIAGFEITTRDPTDNLKDIAIDDLSFDTPSPPPQPSFTIAAARTDIRLVQGTSTTDNLAIDRISGSTGNIGLTASGLPPGMHASFAPNPADGTQTVLTLSADPSAPPTSGAVPIMITGTPQDAAAGSSPFSFSIQVTVLPAFTVQVRGPTNLNLSSCTADTTVEVDRVLSFPGPVSMSVTGLPGAVQANFSPATVAFSAGSLDETTNLEFRAPASGQTILRRTVTIHASAPPFADETATVTVGGTCPLQYDARVTSIQITQGVQSPFLIAQDPLHTPSVTEYSEIPGAAELRAGGTTVVRVYADLAFGPAGGVPNVPAVLYGYTHNEVGARVDLPGSPILPTSQVRTLQLGPADATQAEEGSETAVYTFTLPASWTHGTIGVIGKVLPAQAPPPLAARAAAFGQPVLGPCQTTTCNDNDSMTLSRIPFYNAPGVTIDPVQMEVNGNPLPDPSTVFKWARLVTPLYVSIGPYAGTIDITDIAKRFASCTGKYIDCSNTANDAVSSRFDDWVCDHGAPDPGWDIGVNTGVARGLTNPTDICWQSFSDYSDSVVEWQRPLTSVAHEFFHLLGRPHASDCNGGGSGGQVAESWPPDQMGFTQSVGLDTTLGSGLNGGPYAVPSPPGQTWYDFMSYCANASNTNSPLTLTPAPSWGSTHNWNAVLEAFRYHAQDRPTRPRQTSRPRPSLAVSGFLSHDGTASITTVTPMRAASRAVRQTGLELVGLDAAGHTVATAPFQTTGLHIDHEVQPVGLDGLIPARGVAAVEIVVQGRVLATRRASAHAPTVSVLGLPRTDHGKTTIRWRAHDADGNPLVAAVAYSSDGGRSYRSIWLGPSHGVAVVPSRYLPRSTRARIEVTVNDGFHSATAHSRLFRAPGAPPIVTILTPSSGARQPADAPLVLSGQAFADAGTALRGKQLRWYVDPPTPHLLGTGPEIAPTGLRPGPDVIVLLARDRFGREGQASVRVMIGAARPLFLVLTAPKRAKPSARALRLTVGSSVAARLVVRLSKRAKVQRFNVSRRIRRLRIAIPRGSKGLVLHLTLSAGRLTRTQTIHVLRTVSSTGHAQDFFPLF